MARNGTRDDTQRVLAAIDERSKPNPDKPVPPGSGAAAVKDLERRSAECYADAEMKSYQLRKLARKVARNGDAVLDEMLDDDSMVTNLEDLKKKTEVNGKS